MVTLRVAQDKIPPFVFVPARECLHDDQSRYFVVDHHETFLKSKFVSDRPVLLPETIEPFSVLTLATAKGKITPDSECD